MQVYLDKIHVGLSDILAAEIETAHAQMAALCESPIEIAMGVSLLMLDRLEPCYSTPLIVAMSQEEIEHYGPGARLLIPQFQLDNKRIDFKLQDSESLFIECDGHDFHERTKDQAARDRRRDREVQQTGNVILRFTGSEIFRDPIGCAREVFATVGDIAMRRSIGPRA